VKGLTCRGGRQCTLVTVVGHLVAVSLKACRSSQTDWTSCGAHGARLRCVTVAYSTASQYRATWASLAIGLRRRLDLPGRLDHLGQHAGLGMTAMVAVRCPRMTPDRPSGDSKSLSPRRSGSPLHLLSSPILLWQRVGLGVLYYRGEHRHLVPRVGPVGLELGVSRSVTVGNARCLCSLIFLSSCRLSSISSAHARPRFVTNLFSCLVFRSLLVSSLFLSYFPFFFISPQL